MKLSEAVVGQKVHFMPPYFNEGEYLNGIIKEIPKFASDPNAFVGHNCVRVVFYCNNNWKNYKKYTSSLTKLEELFRGWRQG